MEENNALLRSILSLNRASLTWALLQATGGDDLSAAPGIINWWFCLCNDLYLLLLAVGMLLVDMRAAVRQLFNWMNRVVGMLLVG
jgi:hypothetical protein